MRKARERPSAAVKYCKPEEFSDLVKQKRGADKRTEVPGGGFFYSTSECAKCFGFVLKISPCQGLTCDRI